MTFDGLESITFPLAEREIPNERRSHGGPRCRQALIEL